MTWGKLLNILTVVTEEVNSVCLGFCQFMWDKKGRINNFLHFRIKKPSFSSWNEKTSDELNSNVNKLCVYTKTSVCCWHFNHTICLKPVWWPGLDSNIHTEAVITHTHTPIVSHTWTHFTSVSDTVLKSPTRIKPESRRLRAELSSSSCSSHTHLCLSVYDINCWSPWRWCDWLMMKQMLTDRCCFRVTYRITTERKYFKLTLNNCHFIYVTFKQREAKAGCKELLITLDSSLNQWRALTRSSSM